MNTRILADITPEEQQAAIDFAKNKPQNTEQMVIGDDAVFEISQSWKKTEDWVKRYLAATFLIMLSVTGGISMNNDDHHDFERVRTTNARKGEDV
tara:strand:- start:10088 stop:10372 length:285 start_codon:yes stop_codon:yes gene_type:complete